MFEPERVGDIVRCENEALTHELTALTAATPPMDVRVGEWIVWGERMCLMMADACRVNNGSMKTQVLGVEVHPSRPDVKILTLFVPMTVEPDETLPPL